MTRFTSTLWLTLVVACGSAGDGEPLYQHEVGPPVTAECATGVWMRDGACRCNEVIDSPECAQPDCVYSLGLVLEPDGSAYDLQTHRSAATRTITLLDCRLYTKSWYVTPDGELVKVSETGESLQPAWCSEWLLARGPWMRFDRAPDNLVAAVRGLIAGPGCTSVPYAP